MSHSEKTIEVAERYLSRQPVHTTSASGEPLWTRGQMLRAFYAGQVAVIDDEAPSPVDRGAGWQEIGNAPFNETVVVYWPIVELDEDGDVTDKIVGGEVFVSENQGGFWIEPEAMNAIGEHMGDHETYANHPSHWMPKPCAPEGSVDG